MCLMTYGEAHTYVKYNIELVKGEFVAPELPKHRERMNREDASKYYKKKFSKYFGIPTEPTIKDFDSVDHYFDYFEALKIKKLISVK